MKQTQLHLLRTKRFLPLFITQFFNAFNDNIFKNALVVLITFKIANNISFSQYMIAIAGGIFILPFFLFSASAGQIADKFEKSVIIRWIKFLEIIIMIIGIIGFYLNNLTLLMCTLFFLGCHSTFFGPLKFSILPDHLHKDELLAGNGLIEAGTFIAILLGQILGGSLMTLNNGLTSISIALLMVAILGLISSLFIPKTHIGQPQLILSYNILKDTKDILKLAFENNVIFITILAISWFWFIGATFLTVFPSFTKDVLLAKASIFTLFLSVFTVGIGIGSVLCNILLRGQITVKYVPIILFGMSIVMFDLYLASHNYHPTVIGTELSNFFSSMSNRRILIDVFLLTILAGIFVVPLNALLQARSSEWERSRIMAANNIVNSVFMVLSALFVMAMIALDFSIPQIFVIMAILNLCVCFTILKSMPYMIRHSEVLP